MPAITLKKPPTARGRLAIDRRMNVAARERLVTRMRGEFLELPGLRLTIPQASRLIGVPPDICTRVLETLVRDGLLRRGQDERYGISPS